MWVIAITLNNKYCKNWGRNTYLPVFAGKKTGDAKNWPKTENFLMISGDKKVFIHLDCPL